jgi:hypothetical protein
MKTKITHLVSLLFCFFAFQVMIAQNDGKQSIIPEQYIVVYKSDALALKKQQMIGKSFKTRQQMMREETMSTLSRNGLQKKEVLQVYETALIGFAVKGLSKAEAEKLLLDEQIAFVEPDETVYLSVENDFDMNHKNAQAFEPEAEVSIPLSDNLNNMKDPVYECFSLEINGTPIEFGSSSFGPYSFNVTGQMVLVNDNLSPFIDGCESIINDLSGKIALIKRGTCQYAVKAYNAQLAGAIAVLIYNNTTGPAPSLGLGQNADLVTIPSMGISDIDGQAIVDALALGTVTATMSRFGNIETSQCTPWGITRVGGGLSGIGKRAWIIDSGIDMDHPDLNVNTTLSYSVIDGEPSPDDLNGHGTHVAGTVAAIDNGFGVIGVAAGAEVVAVKVFPNGLTSTSTSNVLAGLNYVAAHAAAGDVVNYSISSSVYELTDMAALAVAEVCPIVISAANAASDANNFSPQRVQSPNVFVISAMDINDNYASFSNYGNPPINYCAPGVKVASTYKNGTYAIMNGTSMAAPHVTGLLLLGDICASSTVNNDPDGTPDPIAEHSLLNTSPTNGGTIAADQEICFGDMPESFSNEVSPSGHTGTLEYQWQISTSSPTFVEISGAVSDTYTHIGTITQTTWFRRLARTSECINLWSNAIASNTVMVSPGGPVPHVEFLPELTGECMVVVSTFPTAAEYCGTDPAIGTITATTSDPLEYTQPGNYTITWTYENADGNTVTQTQSVAVESGSSLTGVVSYYRYNAPNTPLPGVVVKLLNASGDVIGTSTTTFDGEYEFTDLTALLNTVALEVSSEMPHGGMSAIGSLAIQRTALSLPVVYWSPEYFLNHVGNVYRGISPENAVTGPPLNVIDAAFAQQRNMNPAFYFDAGEWAFHSPEDEVIFGNSDINTATRTFTFDGCTQTLDIEARTFGDVRGIYVLQTPGKSSSTLQTEPTIVVAPGEEFSLPVLVKNNLQLSAMNLDLWFDADKIEVLAVESTLPGLQFTIESESIRVFWTSLNPLSVQKDQALVSLRLKTLTEVNENDAVFMQNATTEFGDAMAMAIPGVEIAMNKISNTVTGIASNTKAMQHSFRPNPFTEQAVLQYTLPESGKVSIRILNQFGATVKLATEAYLQAGSHQIIIDDSDLVSGGAYYYQILLESSTKIYQVYGKMVLIK